MNNFYPYNDELYHSRGWTKKNAKYIARKWVNGRWQYVYSRLENAKKQAPGKIDEAKKKGKEAANAIKTQGGKAYNEAKAYGTQKVKDYRRAKAETPSYRGTHMNDRSDFNPNVKITKGSKYVYKNRDGYRLINYGHVEEPDYYADRLNKTMKERNEEIERKKKYQSRASTKGKYYR